MFHRYYCIYIMTNEHHSTLYVGFTNNLQRRVYEHREGIEKKSFTHQYRLKKLVYYEFFEDVRDAMAREKQLKGGSRAKKLALINGLNKEWKDLYADL